MIVLEPLEPPPQANGDELERLAAYDLLASDILTVRERSDHEVVWASASLRTRWGLVSDASRGQRLHWNELVHPEDRPQVLACYEALRAGHPAQLDYRVQLPDGRLRHCKETAKVSLTPRGQSRLLVLTRDVTPQRAWRQEQRGREALEARVVRMEQAAPGVFLHHRQWPDGRTETAWSAPERARAEGWLGSGPDGTSVSLLQCVHPEDRLQLQQQMAAAHDARTPWRVTCRLRHARYGWRWAELRLWPQQEPGATLSCFGFLQDITPQTLLEGELARARSAPERGQPARNAALVQRLCDIDMLTQAVLHDLRAPLREVEGYGRLLAAACPELDGERCQYLDNIRRGCDSMSRKVDELLRHARIDRQKLHIVPLRLADEIGHVLDLLRFEINRHEALVCITLECEEVLADQASLQLVLRHLLENALKFGARAGQVRIDIRSRTQDGRCHLELADKGMGFEPRHREKIFELFLQLNPDASRGGSGIGLSLVRTAVERMGGRVTADGVPGRGACFEVVLPLPAEAERDAALHPSGGSS